MTGKIFCRTKFSTPSRNFEKNFLFLPGFCIEVLDKISDGQHFSSDKIFDTKPKYPQFCPTNFCPIMYCPWISCYCSQFFSWNLLAHKNRCKKIVKTLESNLHWCVWCRHTGKWRYTERLQLLWSNSILLDTKTFDV